MENGNYTLNYKNARKYLKTIKSKKEILKGADYAALAEECKKLDEQYKKEELNRTDFSQIEKNFDSKEFADINDRMNRLFDDVRKLSYMEYKQENGMFSRMKRNLRSFFGFTPKRQNYSKKIIKKRREISRNINAFLEYIDENGYNSQFELYNKAFSRFMGTPQLGLKGIASNIEYSGANSIILPNNEITTDMLKKATIEAMKLQTSDLQSLKKKAEEAKHKAEEMYESLDDKVKEFIKDDLRIYALLTEETVLEVTPELTDYFQLFARKEGGSWKPVKGDRDALPDVDGIYFGVTPDPIIIVPDNCTAGQKIKPELTKGQAPVTKVTWKHNGKELESAELTLTQGVNEIRADVEYLNGNKGSIIRNVTVE